MRFKHQAHSTGTNDAFNVVSAEPA
jgi:hypothetical protein